MGHASAWAETSVKKRQGVHHDYPPVEGEPCAGCGRALAQGERVFKLTSGGEGEWTCETCLSKPDAEAARNGMGT